MPSGGARQGAGRRKIGVSQAQVDLLVKTFKRKAKETGRTWADLLAEIAYDMTAYQVTTPKGKKVIKLSTEVKDRLRALEVFTTYTISKHVEQTKNININNGPQIGLPAIKERPELEINVAPERVN